MKTTPPEILDFEKLIEPNLNGSKVVSYTSKYLTKPGENYGSIMLSISANVKHQDGVIEALPLVAKMPPILNEFYWKLFEPERTSLTENTVYTELVPAIRALEERAGVPEQQYLDVFPRAYGARANLGNDLETGVDRNALLVLENLQTSGYRAGNRGKLFDYNHAVVILEHLARYHAYPIALRTLKPEEYRSKIAPFFRRFDMNQNIAKEMGESLMVKTISDVKKATNNNEDFVNKFQKLLDLSHKFNNNPEECEDGLYSTFAHYDFWINNMMVLYDENNMPSKIKIVDFQTAQYESLAHDVVFFLLTSVDSGILETHYEKFLHHYYDNFVATLQMLGSPIDDYTFESFQAEVTRIGPIQIPHAIFMLKVIFMPSDSVPDNFDDLDPEMFTSNNDSFDEAYYLKVNDVVRLGQKWSFF